jgi:lipid A 3-O-deacylase
MPQRRSFHQVPIHVNDLSTSTPCAPQPTPRNAFRNHARLPDDSVRSGFDVPCWLPRLILVISLATAGASLAEAQTPRLSQPSGSAEMTFTLDPRPASIWMDGRGEGFRTSVQTLSLEAGAAFGPAVLGSLDHHHLALLSLSYGHMLSPVLGKNRWWRGNFELRVECFGGIQFSPHNDWLVGFTPHLRYNFAAGGIWIPFIDAGVGVSLSGIGPPDLGSVFEFNQQGGAGFHWFFRDNLALTVEGRYIHISNAGISDHNHGLNAAVCLLGLTAFF